ncbi:hypothetical protein [Flavobacterium lipolyticum]|uniref:Carboxypeptidase-like regulatory domain-containing protein n=1 Tax=Flavobacterium lipolyticum TaxID=2893754 RepID=A0ABS8M0G3_9FLAO|nr:hypothetical protein [Flavobacterium sp. F-126]MCC9018139.1 hypothetical protein [Flavobacterium sp. F-126]
MKVKLLTTISFFTYQLSVSQSEKVLHGKVMSNNNPLNKVEVINKTGQTSTRTNNLGEFSILVKSRDSLLFFSKDYFFTRLKITQEHIDQNNITVNMIIKPEELNEVVITNIKFDRVKTSQQNIDDIKLAKDAGSLEKYTGVYNGTITNGTDFARLGKDLVSLFKTEDDKPVKTKTPKTDFKKLVAASIPDDFFIKNLNLKPEEKELFIEFCDADPRSKNLLENSNILITMDFMYAKNEMFKKLKTESQN